MTHLPNFRTKFIFRSLSLTFGIFAVLLMWATFPSIGNAANTQAVDHANPRNAGLDASVAPPQPTAKSIQTTGSYKVYLPFISNGTAPIVTGPTYYVDGTIGNDASNGSQTAPWKTIPNAVAKIKPGDTVIINAGIYRASYWFFGPAGVAPNGTIPAKRTTFKAAPNARVLFTDPSSNPTSVEMADYVRIEGLWFGGNRNTSWTQQGYCPGGNPIGIGKEIVNNTFFNFNEGVSGGSNQYTLFQSNRFVNNGQYATKQHAVYLSGDDESKTGGASTHIIVDNNIMIGGEGYGIQGWHSVHDMIFTRNIVTRHNWGVVADGSDHLIANNFFWKEKGDPGTYPWGEYVAGTRIMTFNNIFGQSAWLATDSVAIAPASQNTIDSNAFNTYNMPDYWPVMPQGTNQIMLTDGQESSQLGISALNFDNAVAALQSSFAQPVETIFQDQTIEPNFTKVRSMTLPTTSRLYQTGKRWVNASTPMNIGPTSQVPTTSDGFWAAFRTLGLTEYDRYGNVIP